MSAILRLYPRAWRERYGDELVALLEDRPASLLDQIDLIRGAFDARLHPQVPGAAGPEPQVSVHQRLYGGMAAIGGIAWIVGVASMFVLPRDLDGYRDLSLAMLGMALAIALIGVALAELGTRDGSPSSRRMRRLASLVSIALALTLPTFWPAFLIGLFGFPVMAAGLAIRGARNGVLPGWFALISSVAGLAVLSAIGADSQAGRDQQLALLVVVGFPALLLAWLVQRGWGAPAAVPPAPEPA